MGVAKSGRGMRVVELPERKEALEKKKKKKNHSLRSQSSLWLESPAAIQTCCCPTTIKVSYSSL